MNARPPGLSEPSPLLARVLLQDIKGERELGEDDAAVLLVVQLQQQLVEDGELARAANDLVHGLLVRRGEQERVVHALAQLRAREKSAGATKRARKKRVGWGGGDSEKVVRRDELRLSVQYSVF